MTQPIRLRDGVDPTLRELLRYTKAVGAPSAARVDELTARVLAELSAPITDDARDGEHAPARKLGLTRAQWLLGFAILLALGFIGYRLLGRAPHVEPSVSAARATPAPAAQVAAPAELLDTRPQTQEPEIERATPRTQTRRRSKPATIRVDPTAEIVILQSARQTLASDPHATLALVAQHQREHPAGVFTEEREALAVEALWRAGDGEQAADRLRALLARYPRSTYRERLTALLARPR